MNDMKNARFGSDLNFELSRLLVRLQLQASDRRSCFYSSPLDMPREQQDKLQCQMILLLCCRQALNVFHGGTNAP